jgi:hypothetical protein
MNRLFVVIAVALVLLAGCKSKSASPSAVPARVSYSISGKILTPTSPVQGAGVHLIAFSDEACAKLDNKQTLSADEKKRREECWKQTAEMKTTEKGEYTFDDIKPGWYKLLIGWQVTLKSNLESGADYTGEYSTYYGRVKDVPDRFGIGVLGHPFNFPATESVTKNLLYERPPYASAKN